MSGRMDGCEAATDIYGDLSFLEKVANEIKEGIKSRDTELICSKIISGESIDSVIKEFNINKKDLLLLMRQNDIEMRGRHIPHNKTTLTNEQKKNLVDEYSSGRKSQQLEDKYRINDKSVLKILKEGGVRIREKGEQKRKYLDETVFDDPLTEDARYWIGFLIGDGAVVENGFAPKISLGLAEKDLPHIEKFRKFLKSEHTITRRAGERKGKISIGYSLQFTSKKISSRLEEFGFTPNKSFTAKLFKLENDIHAWRGLIDADGSVMIAQGYPKIQLVGSFDIVSQFLDFAKNIKTNRASVNKHGKIFKTVITGHPAEKVVEVLYRNATIYLERKKILAQRIIDHDFTREYSVKSAEPVSINGVI